MWESPSLNMDSDAVVVDKVVVGYGKTTILSELSMRVKKGTIFALLGPSGCGKTTLLSCILGRKDVKAGEIRVFNGAPGDRSIGLPGGLVGFMPQDICLYLEFTIQVNIVHYCSVICGKNVAESWTLKAEIYIDLFRRHSHTLGDSKGCQET